MSARPPGRAEERYRALVESLPAIVFIATLDEVPRMIYVSPQVEDLLGFPRRRWLEEPELWIEMVHPDDRSLLLEEARRVGRTGEPGCAEYRVSTASGRYLWLRTEGRLVHSASGTAHLQGVSLDVTERKEAERLARRRRRELEEAVQRTAVRAQQLERERAELEKAGALGRMAARIAHEINNPLAGIKNAFLLVQDAVPAGHPYASYVDMIAKEIDRIALIVRQMFELYRPDAEASRPCRVDQAVREVVTLLAPRSREARVRVEVDVEGAGRPLAVAEALVRQVLYNLVENAIEASAPGGVVTVVATAGAELVIHVVDRGHGIAAEHLPHVFEPFFTTKATIGDRRHVGLGLGLSIAKRAAEAMKGSIRLGSKPDLGTTCTVTIPVREEAPGGERGAGGARSGETTGAAS